MYHHILSDLICLLKLSRNSYAKSNSFHEGPGNSLKTKKTSPDVTITSELFVFCLLHLYWKYRVVNIGLTNRWHSPDSSYLSFERKQHQGNMSPPSPEEELTWILCIELLFPLKVWAGRAELAFSATHLSRHRESREPLWTAVCLCMSECVIKASF